MERRRNAGLSDLAIRAWLKTAKIGAMLHDGGGLYLRQRVDGAFWALRQVNVATGKRTAGVLPKVSDGRF